MTALANRWVMVAAESGEPAAWAFLLVMAVMFVGVGVVLLVIGRRAADGLLEPNPWSGIRTKATMASPEAWYAGHRAAAGFLKALGGISIVGGLLFLARPSYALTVVLVVVLAHVLIGFTLAAAKKADDAAKKVDR